MRLFLVWMVLAFGVPTLMALLIGVGYLTVEVTGWPAALVTVGMVLSLAWFALTARWVYK